MGRVIWFKTEKRSSGTTTYSYDDNDRLISQTDPSGTVGYDYDSNGNMTRAGTRTYAYDMSGRMSSTTSGSTTYNYKYDGDGTRLKATWGPTADETINFSWDVNWPLPEIAHERDGNNNTLRRYVNGNDLISMRVDGTTNHYYHHDALGSVAALTSATGAPEWSYRYEPFGEEKTAVKELATAPTNLMRFAGERLDSGIGGSYHLRARQYDPSLGTFQAADPLPAAASVPYTSTYSYVGARPTTLSDPSGMSAVCGGSPNGDWLYDVGDFFAGWGDAGSLGVTNLMRDAMGTNDAVNKCSTTYAAGELTGVTNASAISIGGLRSATRGISSLTRHGIDVADLRLSGTVANHLDEITKTGQAARPYLNSRLTMREIMEAGNAIPDPGGVPGALRWDVGGTFRGSEGAWELVVDPNTNTVLHFLFRSGG